MKESELLRLQVNRTVALLENTILRYYDALYELRRLTLILFDTHKTDKGQVDDWFAREGFGIDADGFWLSLPLLESYRSGRAPKDAISHSWNPQLKDHQDARSRMYCLRNIGSYLHEIHSRHSDIAWIYYQDTTNTSIQFPYIDQKTAISPDFEWSSYHTFVSVEPVTNPERIIRWTPPTIDYAGEGLILSVSIPVYHQDTFVGVWSMDIPMRTLHQNFIQESYVAGQRNFIINHESSIIAHPSFPLKISKDKGSFLQEQISVLGEDYKQLDPMALIQQKQGELQLNGEDDQEMLTYFGAVPGINWIFFVTVPMSCMLDAANRRIRTAFNKIMEGDLDFRLTDPAATGQRGLLIEGYNEMADALQQQRDVRLKAEKAERESAQKYRLLVNNANDAIFIVQDEKITFANPKFFKMSGYTEDELAEVSFFDTVHPEHLNVVLAKHTTALNGNEEPFTYSYKIINKSGIDIWLQLNSVLISWEGRPGILHFARDITEQKQLESQLNHAQKMEAIGTLAGGIAHDFNNILSAIFGYTELANAEVAEQSEAKRYLHQVLRASNRAKQLIVQILSFSRQREEKPEPIQIGPIITETIKLLRASLPSTIEIREHIAASRMIVQADSTKMQQVIMNLCTNAYHAMRDKGGVLDVTLDTVDLQYDKEANSFNQSSGPYIRINVQDTGCGMAPETMERIFEPYFTSKKQGEGTGLGLALVHGIVKSYGGHITVDSKLDKGSTFTIYLPQTAVQESHDRVNGSHVMPQGHEHILLIDDEPAITDIGKRMLEKLGYMVTTRTSSIESLELFRSQPVRFDLVITDMTMPNLTGLEIAQQFLAIRPEIPIILCTGFSELVTTAIVEEVGIKALVLKPLVLRDLAQIIRDILDTQEPFPPKP